MSIYLEKLKTLTRLTVCFTFYSMVGFTLLIGAVPSNNLFAKPAAGSSDSEKQTVEDAVVHYKAGDITAAKRILVAAESKATDNFAVPYYLGLIYLEEGDLSNTISKWQRYVAMAPPSENRLKIQKYLSILLREQAGENARSVVSQVVTPTAGNTIAVTAFENKGYIAFGPLGKGIAAMLRADLSKVPGLEVVDRIEMLMLLKEMGTGTSGLVNTGQVSQVGSLMKAKYITTGSLMDSESEKMQISSEVYGTAQKTTIATHVAEGTLTQINATEKRIACAIVADIGGDCKKMPKAFHEVHTHSLPALVAFSWGLEYGDQEKYDKAREMFQKALEEDPRFTLAEKALAAAPTSAMVTQTKSHMIAEASSIGPAPSVAQSAIAPKKGTSKTKWIIGGVAVLGGAAALAGGGGGGGGGITDPEPPGPGTTDPPLKGRFSGSWTPPNGSPVTITMDLDQSASGISGNFQIPGWDCMPSGSISVGNFDDSSNSVDLELTPDGSNTATIKGTCMDTNCNEISGATLTFGTPTEPCNSASGIVHLKKHASVTPIW